MALIKCSECGREISDKATACPGCGAPTAALPTAAATPADSGAAPAATKPKQSRALSFLGIAVLVVVLGFGALMIIGAVVKPAPGDSEICVQSAVAARYIAAESGVNPGGVNAVTDDAIARNAYPALGDKGVAMLGAIVSMEFAAGKTPDEIAGIARSACEHASAPSAGN